MVWRGLGPGTWRSASAWPGILAPSALAQRGPASKPTTRSRGSKRATSRRLHCLLGLELPRLAIGAYPG